MGRCPQRETSQSRLTADAGDVVAFAYDTYTTSHNNKGVLGGTLTVDWERNAAAGRCFQWQAGRMPYMGRGAVRAPSE